MKKLTGKEIEELIEADDNYGLSDQIYIASFISNKMKELCCMLDRYDTNDKDFYLMASAPQIAEQYLQARNFQVNDEFIDRFIKNSKREFSEETLNDVFVMRGIRKTIEDDLQAAIKTLFEMVEE